MGNGKNLPEHGILKTNPQLAMLNDLQKKFAPPPNSLTLGKIVRKGSGAADG